MKYQINNFIKSSSFILAILITPDFSLAVDVMEGQVAHYHKVWEQELIERNNLSSNWFSDHVFIDREYTHKGGMGESFSVYYNVKIDWAEIPCHDNFIININSDVISKSNFDYPTDTYLSTENIRNIITRNFGSQLTKIDITKELKYKSKDKAVKDLQVAAGTNKIGFKRLTYWVPGKIPRMDGYPYMMGYGAINRPMNQCIQGYINLVTGEATTRKSVCRKH